MENSNRTVEPDVTASALVARCRSGDLSAFQTLMESHQQYAYALAYRVLREDDQAKDVVQEAFVRVWRHIGEYRSNVKFTTWLYKIVVHLCYDSMKMKSRRYRIFRMFSGHISDAEIPDSRNLGDEYEKKEAAEHILAIARKLPPKQRLVFMLRDVQDFTIDEIAAATDMSTSSVKANLCYARHSIRTMYKELEPRGEQ